MITPLTYSPLIDELSFTALPLASWAVEKMQEWMRSPHPALGRVGWNLTIDQIMQKKKLPMDIDSLLAWIEKETKDAPELKQWAMNRCLCEIGIRMREYTDRCVKIGEKLGRLDNRPVPMGCYSSYAPEWIAAGLRLAEQRKRR
jgi:3-methyladenine DNA glycosylase AlkD